MEFLASDNGFPAPEGSFSDFLKDEMKQNESIDPLILSKEKGTYLQPSSVFNNGNVQLDVELGLSDLHLEARPPMATKLADSNTQTGGSIVEPLKGTVLLLPDAPEIEKRRFSKADMEERVDRRFHEIEARL